MIVAVILGNRMNDNGTLSALARKRLDLAEKLYKEYSPEEIILSGGRANPKVDVTEADAMLKELKRRGNIDEKRNLAGREIHVDQRKREIFRADGA